MKIKFGDVVFAKTDTASTFYKEMTEFLKWTNDFKRTDTTEDDYIEFITRPQDVEKYIQQKVADGQTTLTLDIPDGLGGTVQVNIDMNFWEIWNAVVTDALNSTVYSNSGVWLTNGVWIHAKSAILTETIPVGLPNRDIYDGDGNIIGTHNFTTWNPTSINTSVDDPETTGTNEAGTEVLLGTNVFNRVLTMAETKVLYDWINHVDQSALEGKILYQKEAQDLLKTPIFNQPE